MATLVLPAFAGPPAGGGTAARRHRRIDRGGPGLAGKSRGAHSTSVSTSVDCTGDRMPLVGTKRWVAPAGATGWLVHARLGESPTLVWVRPDDPGVTVETESRVTACCAPCTWTRTCPPAHDRGRQRGGCGLPAGPGISRGCSSAASLRHRPARVLPHAGLPQDLRAVRPRDRREPGLAAPHGGRLRRRDGLRRAAGRQLSRSARRSRLPAARGRAGQGPDRRARHRPVPRGGSSWYRRNRLAPTSTT